MISSYYNISEFFNTISLAHPNISSFTMGDLEDVDLKKHTLFPLAHLMVNNVTVAEGKIVYDVTYLVMDKPQNITPESTTKDNKLQYDYSGVTDTNDVFNTTLEAINDIYSYILRNPDALDYNIVGEATLTPFKDRFDNLLAGWGADFSISVGNVNNMCALDASAINLTPPAVDLARRALSASFAETSSYALTAYTFSSSYAFTASYFDGNSVSASYALKADTASYALNVPAPNPSSSWASSSLSSSFARTASYALNVPAPNPSSSWASSSLSSSFARTASYVALPATYSQAYTASFITGSNVRGIVSRSYSASLAETASYYGGTVELPEGLLTTGALLTSQSFTGSLYVTGAIIFTSSISDQYNSKISLGDLSGNNTGLRLDWNTGSAPGDISYERYIYADRNQFRSKFYQQTSVDVSGSIEVSTTASLINQTYNSVGISSGIATVLVDSGRTSIQGDVIEFNGPITASYITASIVKSTQFTGSLYGTASYAETASYISGSSPGFPFTGSAVISGTLYVSNSTQGVNVFATASNAISTSLALTSSFITGSDVKGIVSSSYSSSLAVTASYVDLTTGSSGILTVKDLLKANYLATANYTDDAAAAAGGIPINGIYRSGNILVVRLA